MLTWWSPFRCLALSARLERRTRLDHRRRSGFWPVLTGRTHRSRSDTGRVPDPRRGNRPLGDHRHRNRHRGDSLLRSGADDRRHLEPLPARRAPRSPGARARSRARAPRRAGPAAGVRPCAVDRDIAGVPDFSGPRGFYTGLGYHEEARIRDFYEPATTKSSTGRTYTPRIPRADSAGKRSTLARLVPTRDISRLKEDGCPLSGVTLSGALCKPVCKPDVTG
jgi:hypothetical protein